MSGGGKFGEAGAGGTGGGSGEQGLGQDDGAQAGRQGKESSNRASVDATIIPMTNMRTLLVSHFQNRDDCVPARPHQILNPSIRLNASGRWSWLQPTVDGPAAMVAGFSTPEEWAEARYLGLLPAGFTSPSVVFEVDRRYLNPMTTQPTPFGHWKFLSDGPWIPAVSLGQQRIQEAQELQRIRAETRRHIAEARARAQRDRRCIAEERAIAAETRLRTRRDGSDTSPELNRGRIAQDLDPIIDRSLPPFRYQRPGHTNTREPKINTDTLTKLITRINSDVVVHEPVQVDHLAYNFAISFGRYPNDQIGYPSHNMTSVTTEGVVIGTYNEDGEVWDLKRNYLGSLMSMGVD
ncbi:hypothetical protein KCU78_g5538, partial [Aureobasidium melanogenum]